MEFKSWNGGMKSLLNCPFCCGEPIVYHKGNDYTKTREIIIKCSVCRAERTDAARRFDFDKLEDIAIKNWNQRPAT